MSNEVIVAPAAVPYPEEVLTAPKFTIDNSPPSPVDAEGFTYTRADGTVETATNAADAIRRCPVLGKLPLEQANVLLELQAIGKEKLEAKKGAPETSRPETIKPRADETIPAENKGTQEKTPSKDKLVPASKPESQIIEIMAAVNTKANEPKRETNKTYVSLDADQQQLPVALKSKISAVSKQPAMEAPGSALDPAAEILTPAKVQLNESKLEPPKSNERISAPEFPAHTEMIEAATRYDYLRVKTEIEDRFSDLKVDITLEDLPPIKELDTAAPKEAASAMQPDHEEPLSQPATESLIADDTEDILPNMTDEPLGIEPLSAMLIEPEKFMPLEIVTADIIDISASNTPNIDTENDYHPKVLISEKTWETYSKLLMIMDGGGTETVAAAVKSSSVSEDAQSVVASTEEAEAENLEKNSELEPAYDSTINMEKIIAGAQEGQPLEETYSQLSSVLCEIDTNQTYTPPIVSLLAKIVQKLPELTRAKEETQLEDPAILTPEVTQLFIDLLEEIGYKDPHKVLLTFVSQRSIKELVQVAVYLHQLAESGDQKEYLSNRLFPVISNVSDLPLTTRIGRTIIQIIKPELQTLAAAA